MLRVLGSVRLSRMTDASTSPARQRERIEYWSAGNDGQIIYTAEDLDVSGAVSPFERPDLGDWLTEERAGQWDVLVAWKLDRLSRSASDTLRLLEWCEAHGKRIVCVDDSIDSATQMGQVWLQLAGIFAQVERTFIKERAVSSRRELRSEGRWHGEAVMYGYRPEKRQAGGWKLAIDPYSSGVLRRIIDRVLDGRSIESVAAELTEDHVFPPRQYRRILTGLMVELKPWRSTTLMNLLTSRSLLGHVTYEKEVFYDAEGVPVLKADPLIDREKFDRLQAVVAARRKSKDPMRTRNVSPLMGLAYCHVCGAKLHHRGQHIGGKLYRYYQCSAKCGEKSLRAPDLEWFAVREFLREIGDRRIAEKTLIPGDDNTAELAAAVSAIEDLTRLAGTAKSRTAQKLYADQMAALDEKIARLENTPRRPDEWQWTVTDQTYGEAFWTGDFEAKRNLLLRSGLTVKSDYTVDIPLETLGRSLPGDAQWYADRELLPQDVFPGFA